MTTTAPDQSAQTPSAEPAFWTIAEMAQRLRISNDTLAALRRRGDGPPFIRIGRSVRYPIEQVREWEASAAVTRTCESEACAAAEWSRQRDVEHGRGRHRPHSRSARRPPSTPGSAPPELPPAFRRLLDRINSG